MTNESTPTPSPASDLPQAAPEAGKRLVSALVLAAWRQEREPCEENQIAYRKAREAVEAALATPLQADAPKVAEAECIGTQIAKDEFAKRWNEAYQRRYDQNVTPEYLQWLQDSAPREGVGGNVAWNAGVAWARATPSPAPSAAPHQGADALREALARLETAVDWHLGRSGFTQSTQLKGTAHGEAVRKELYAAHDAARAALAQHQAPQQGEQG